MRSCGFDLNKPMLVNELDTPALIVDLDIMEANLARVANYASQHGLKLRPHTKTHKSTMLAKRQIALGAVGLAVAKVTEAEVMLGAETSDLLIAYPVVGAEKLAKLANLAKRTQITVALDSLEVALPISAVAVEHGVEIGILVEIDVGLGRVGVSPEKGLALAQGIAALPNLRFRGITFYPGHIKHPEEPAGAANLAALSETVGKLVAEFSAAGLKPEVVSGGSTPALFHSHEIAGITEIRPGTYIFNDLNTVSSGACALEECAASILVTVVSNVRSGHMIVDGGSKTFSSDRLTSGEVGHGRLMEAPGALFHKMNEEHGFVDLSKAGREFSVGEKVRIIPNHICVAVNLHENVYGVRNGTVEEVWKVEGRGKLQ